MTRPYIVLLSVLFLISCAGKNTQTAEQTELFSENEITQQEVVETSIDNSALYRQFSDLRIQGPVIPGLRQPLVPQGMAFWIEQGLMIISNYMDNNSAGVLTFIDLESGTLHKILRLYNSDKTPHTGHLGGLAVGGNHLWIVSGSGVYPLRLEVVGSAENNGKIYLPKLLTTETKGSFATFYKDTLWIGEFTRKDGSYSTAEHHHCTDREGKLRRGWLAGYIPDAESGQLSSVIAANGKITPDFIISIPDEIQGAVFTEEKVFLSASYGRKNKSRLLIFDSPLEEPSHQQSEIFPDHTIPFWFIDGLNKTGEIEMPPMSEAVVYSKGQVAVLFESAASKYRATADFPLDRIQYLPVAGLAEF